MTRSSLIVVLCLAAIAVPSAAAEPTPVAYDAPRLENIRIDGNPADWADGGLRVNILGPENDNFAPAGDSNVRMRLAWDDAGLLVLLEVQDDVWLESAGESDLWRNDGAELFMAAAPGAGDWCQWIVAPGVAPEQPTLRSSFSNHRNGALRELDAKPELARTKTDGGYTLEARLPWASLAIKPAVGLVVGFQAIVNDVDIRGDKRSFAAWFPGTNTAAFSWMMHRVRLAAEAGPAVNLRCWQTYDFAAMKPVVAVRAPAVEVGRTVAITRGHKTLTTATLADDGAGRAAATLRLPAPPAGQPYIDLLVALADQPAGMLSFAGAGNLAKAEILLHQRDALRAQYGLDRPWDDLADAPALVRRHRGLVARALGWLDEGPGNDAEKRLAALAEAADIMAAISKGEDYLGSQRNEFTSAYFSRVDGSGQPYVARVPQDYDPQRKYPLFIILHGRGGRPEPRAGQVFRGDFLTAQPWGRGDTMYQALGEDDVLQVIAHMRQWYTIDPNRIYIDGGSMGGMGTWRMSSLYPDIFAAAAPLFGSGNGLPLENLRNVPIFVMHGGSDWTVSVDNSRFAVSRLQQLGYATAHKEFPAAGHFIPQGENFTGDWMLTLRKPDRPEGITYTCQTEDRGRAYWAAIRQFADVHRPATIRARVLGKGKYQLVTVDGENLQVVELDLATMDLDSSAELLVQVGRTHLTRPAPLPERLFLVLADGGWTLADDWSPAASQIRAYHAGAAANLFSGEPLMIVYGTAGSEARDAVLAGAAERLRSFCGVPGSVVVTGRLPAKADTDVTAEDMAHYNLILLGGPRDNALTARMADKLPYTVNDKNELLAGSREPLALGGAGVRLFYYNPLDPERLIFLIAADETSPAADQWLVRAERWLTGSEGERRGDQADLIVQTLGGADRRRMQLGRDWKWVQVDGAETPAPAKYASAVEYRKAVARVICRTGRADYALIGGISDNAMAYEPAYFRVADLCVGYDDIPQVLLADMSGRDMRQIYRLFVATGRLIAEPAIDGDAIDVDKTYRLAIPPTLVRMLSTQRHRNLTGVRAGPEWPVEDLWREMLR